VRRLRPASRVLLAGAGLVGVAWLLAPSPVPPLYDGLSGPSEAYRYVSPPPGYPSTPPPSSASKQLTVTGGVVPAAFVATEEQPPQAQLLVGEGSVAAPAGAHTVTLSVKPVAPPAPLPASDGRIDGNVYQAGATGDSGGEATIKPGASTTLPTMVLRGPPGSGSGTIWRYQAGGSWSKLDTKPLGGQVQDMLAASTDSFGFFAIVLPASGGSSSSSTSGGGGGGGGGGSFPVVAVVVPLVLVVLIGGLLAAIRMSRARSAAAQRGRRGGRGGRSRR